MNALTAELVRHQLDYDPDSGKLTWRNSTSNRVNLGMEAGCLDGKGYRSIHIAGRKERGHRLAWLYTYGQLPEEQIDHINGDKSDNRIANLRLATDSGNRQNMRRARRDSTSGIIGARYDRRRGCWNAGITVDKRHYWLGRFGSAEEAHAAYLAAKRELHPFGMI